MKNAQREYAKEKADAAFERRMKQKTDSKIESDCGPKADDVRHAESRKKLKQEVLESVRYVAAPQQPVYVLLSSKIVDASITNSLAPVVDSVNLLSRRQREPRSRNNFDERS